MIKLIELIMKIYISCIFSKIRFIRPKKERFKNDTIFCFRTLYTHDLEAYISKVGW